MVDMVDGYSYPQSRVRILVELYARAYWRYYVTAATWTGASMVVLDQLPPFSH